LEREAMKRVGFAKGESRLGINQDQDERDRRVRCRVALYDYRTD